MWRLPSSYNKGNITDEEIDEVYYGILRSSVEIPLQPRDYGERVLYIGITSTRPALVEIGIEDQNGKLVVFHSRDATSKSIEEYEAQTYGRS